ncbi:MAG: arginine--tRNA ligase [Candidatus Bipolaricaulota bacterium]
MAAPRDTYLEGLVRDALLDAYRGLRGVEPTVYSDVRPSERPEFGDYATNLAMLAAKHEGLAPRPLAEALTAELAERASESGLRAEVAGPGFINVFLSSHHLHNALRGMLGAGPSYGASALGGGRRVQVEFVSSNPTGPLTVGHGRQAVLGDVLASLYGELGYDVEREYYFNDEGRQVDLLAESLWIRYRELFGEAREIPEGGYQGEYLKDLAAAVRDALGDGFETFDEKARKAFRDEVVARISEGIRRDLHALGIAFDRFFSEATLHREGKVDAALGLLRTRGAVYERDGAVWLRAEHVRGGKDSVLVRSDGRPTYLLVDIAYHLDKRERGLDLVIDVQGADHVTEQACMKAAAGALGFPEGFLNYAVHQFVSLKRGGVVQRMSTRAGRFVTLRDLLDEVGPDMVRYFMISKKPEAHLDFDLDLAKSQSLDNPATTIQYAHTRLASLFRKAGRLADELDAADLAPLTSADDVALIKALDRFPKIVWTAAEAFGPHLLAEYALDLARTSHGYYDRNRVLGEPEAVGRARLALLRVTRGVLHKSLGLLGMVAPEEM